MRNHRKQRIACLMAAAMAVTAVTGCQKTGASPGQSQVAGESSGPEADMTGKEEQEPMEKQKYSKGETCKAREPEKAELSNFFKLFDNLIFLSDRMLKKAFHSHFVTLFFMVSSRRLPQPANAP